MSVDPDDLGTLEGAGGDSGTPTPSQGDAAARIAQLEQENAKLREDKRAERARAVGAEFHLTPTQVELLKLVPADQIEDKAKALASEMAAAPAAPAPAPAGDAPASEPPAPLPPPAEGVLASFDGPPTGNPPAAPALSWQDEMHKRVKEAKSMEEIAAIQLEYKQRQSAGGLS
jgi:hypothetical protein